MTYRAAFRSFLYSLLTVGLWAEVIAAMLVRDLAKLIQSRMTLAARDGRRQIDALEKAQ